MKHVLSYHLRATLRKAAPMLTPLCASAAGKQGRLPYVVGLLMLIAG